jgi:cobalt-zinc-cadmium efflux system membrane fusion protein
MNRLFIVTGLCVVALASCKPHKAAQESADIRYEGDTVVIKETSPVLKEISTAEARLQDFSAEFRTVGTVRPVSGKLAEIAPPFAGRITKSHVKLGQRVEAGAPVFELGSSDFYEAVKNYFAARSANELARRNYLRLKDLADHGVASQKDWEQAQSEADIAGKEWEQAQAILHIFNVDEASLRTGQSLKVVSPLSGEVVRCRITPGSYAREDAEPLAVIADLSEVWVAALVKEKYFGAIRQGDRVEVSADAHPDKTVGGTIYHIGEMLDEETRSLEVIVQCRNADRELKIGMFCEVRFLSAPSKAIVLPSTAVMQEQENAYVLVKASERVFVRRSVSTETVHADSVRIVSGIAEGEQVVVRGGIYLNM